MKLEAPPQTTLNDVDGFKITILSRVPLKYTESV